MEADLALQLKVLLLTYKAVVAVRYRELMTRSDCQVQNYILFPMSRSWIMVGSEQYFGTHCGTCRQRLRT